MLLFLSSQNPRLGCDRKKYVASATVVDLSTDTTHRIGCIACDLGSINSRYSGRMVVYCPLEASQDGQ